MLTPRDRPMNQRQQQPHHTAKVGVGLRPTHYPYLEAKPPTAMRWFEAITENYMDSQGRPLKMLERIREDYPIALHGVSLSIASTEDLRPSYLQQLKKLKDRIEPFLISDHLCWTGLHDGNLHDLLPIPYTNEALAFILKHLDQVQNVLGCPILLENVSTYLQLSDSIYPEWEFLTLVAKQSGCKLLLDINNLYVNAINHHFNPHEFLDAIPIDVIGQIHLAGYTDMGTYLFDTHSKPVYPEVWELFSKLIARNPAIPFLVEWDDEIPEFAVLEAEALKAVHIWEHHHGHHDTESVPATLLASSQ